MLTGRLTRRVLLTLGSAGASLAATIAGGSGRGVLAANAPQDEILIGGNFVVDIQGAASSRDCVSADVDPIEIEEQDATRTNDGRGKTSPLVAGAARFRFVTRVESGNADLAAWVQAAQRGDDVRKDITITLMKQDRSPARTWTLRDCYPVKWDPGDFDTSGEANIAELVVRPTRVELA